jgi:RNA polymerase sigma-70 factor (ECF subfamily)
MEVMYGVMDMLLLRGLRGGNENALERVIEKYTAYVCVIIRNAGCAALTREDIEEIASDVFLALWDNAERAEKLKAYLAATARNKARNKLREAAESLPLDENIPSGGAAPDDALITEDERQTVKSAVLAMEDTDCEMFLRHYYGSQTVSEIARETGVNEAAVKQRLSRGRKKLRLKIEKEVFGQ